MEKIKSTATGMVVVTPVFMNSAICVKSKPQTTAQRIGTMTKIGVGCALDCKSRKMIKKIITKPVTASNMKNLHSQSNFTLT